MSSNSYNEKVKRMLPADQLEKLRGLKFSDQIKVVRPEEGDDFLFMFKEKADYSDFFFKVEEFATVRDIQGYKCSWKPRNSASPNATSKFQPATSIDKAITQWAAVVARYQVDDTIFDDPIEKAHKEWFSGQLKLTDESSERPFTGEQLLYLIEHYDRLNEEVGKHEEVDEAVKQELEKEINDQKSLIGSISKKEAFDRLLTTWAKVTKKAPSVMQFIKHEFASWLTQKMFDGTIERIAGMLGN